MSNKLKPNQLPISSSESESESGSEDDNEQQISSSESDEVSDSGSDPKQFQEPKNTLLPPPTNIKKPINPPPDDSDESESDSDQDLDKNDLIDKGNSSNHVKPLKGFVQNQKPMSKLASDDSDDESSESSDSPAKDLDKNDVVSKGKNSNHGKVNKGFVQNEKPMLKLVSDFSDSKKRSPANIPASEGKKVKRTDGGDEDVKKQLFQRLFSEEDEIVILEGMIEYKNAVNDMSGFYEYVKKMLHVEFSKAQLIDKVRRLRKKYEKNSGKGKKGKERMSFSKSNERKGYELSKLIWGGNNGVESKNNGGKGVSSSGTPVESKKNGKGYGAGTSSGGTPAVKANGGVVDEDVVMMEVENSMDVNRFVRFGGRSDGSVLEEEIVKGGLELLEGSKREEAEAKWKKLKTQELELYAKRMELLQEQVALVIDAVKTSGN